MTAARSPRATVLTLRGARCLVWLLGRGLAALVLAALAVVVVLPRATHGSAMTVLTGSMAPGIPVNSIVMVRPVDTGTLRVGDVATYQREPGTDFVTHRIVGIDTSTSPTTFTFRGDANGGPDVFPVPAAAIRGKVWFDVPYLGAIRDGVHHHGGITLIALLLLAGYAIRKAGSGPGHGRRPRESVATRVHWSSG